jgi:hypothetical protein
MKCSALLVAACVPAIGHVAAAEPGDVSWRLVRPTNTGVPGDFTHFIFIDDDDSPWVCGYVPFWEEGGVGHFDGHNWRVLGNVECGQVASPRFNDIVKTADGVMWIGSDNGLLRFDPSVEPWCVTRFHTGNSPLRGNQIVGLDIAPDGTLWIADQEFGGSAAGGLGHYDPATNQWEFWDTSNGLPWWAGWDWVDYVAVQPDATGGYTVWFGSSEMGLTTYKDGLFIWYGGPTPPDVTPLPRGVGGHDPVDDEGNILLSTDQGIAFRSPAGAYSIVGGYPAGLSSEVSVYEPISGGRVLLGTFYADVFLWDGVWSYLGNWGSGNHTYTLGEDSTGAFWAGGIGGSSKYEDGQWQRHRLTNSGMLDFFIGDVALADNGDVAMTANAGPGVGGFDILHPDGTWTNANVATYGIGLPWPYPTDNTSAVEFRANGNLLFAPTNNGLREYVDQEGFIDLITQAYDIEHIALSRNGRGWAATGRSVAFRENDDGIWQLFGNGNGVPIGDICGVVADPLNPDAVWIGAQFGIGRTTDGQNWFLVPREAVGLNLDTLGYHITAFDVAEDGTLWFGSGIGLFHYDPQTGLYDTYDLTNAPLPSDDIFNVEIAPDGSVWISMFDHIFPYPGGVAQLKDGVWRVWRQGTSPLPHNQINDLATRVTPEGYEVWIATASEAIAVMAVEGEPGCPADFNGDGLLDFFDVADFLDAFSAQDPSADLTGDGLFDFFDAQEFLGLFAAGCA